MYISDIYPGNQNIVNGHKFKKKKKERKFLLVKNSSLSPLASLLQTIWLEEGHMLVNSSHVLVHIRAVLGLVIAVDAPEAALAMMIDAGTMMPRQAVLRRNAMRNGQTGATKTVEPVVVVGHGSTWKNCQRIRRIKRVVCFSALLVNTSTFQ
jgi:hypothetical protein